MRKWLLPLLCFAFILTPLLESRGKKNILLITIDTLRRDRVSVYSSKYVHTPHIEKLAEKSIVFERAFAHTSLTLPSHASILTGTTPLYHGISDNNRFRLDEKFLTLAEHLKKEGYATAAFTASFVLNEQYGLNQGFDLYSGPELTVQLVAEEVIGPAVKWIGGAEGPWFLWIHLWDPHEPYDPPDPYKTRFRSDLYSGEAAYTDAQLGILFTYLEETGFFGNTAMVLTADHGEALGDHFELAHGHFVYNETIHVPLILFSPGIRHSIVKSTVSHIDIFPTICDLAGASTPSHIQGQTLITVMKGESKLEQPVYIEAKSAYYNQGWPPLTGFIDKDMKFIRLPIPELYNLKNDYHEHRNLISTANIPEISAKLDRLIANLTGPGRAVARWRGNKAAQRKLKALGYLTGSSGIRRSAFSKEDDPKIQLPFSRAATFENRGDFKKALKLLFMLKKRYPYFITASLRIADIYLDTGQIEAGLRFIGEELKQRPSNTGLLLRKGLLLIKSEAYESGGEVLGSVIRYLGRSFEALPRTKKSPAEEVRRCILILKHEFYHRLKPRVRAALQSALEQLGQK